jgi:hypothetical protein
VADMQSTIPGYDPGDYGWGKIHGRINEGADGNLYFGTYWGVAGPPAEANYVGEHIIKHNPYTGVSTDLGMVDDGTGFTKYGFPSSNMWSDGMVWYAEALNKDTYDYSFLAYDVLGQQVKLLASHP